MYKIRELRLKKGWTQTELAELSGIAQSAISDIESNKRDPGYKTLFKIAQALGVTVTELVDESAIQITQNIL